MDLQKNDRVLADKVALARFVDELIEDRYKGTLPTNVAEEKQVLLQELNEAMNTHLVRLLSDKDQIALDDLLNKNASDDEVNRFFLEKIPKLEVEIASALLNFRAAYLLPVPRPEAGVSQAENVSSDVPPPPPPAPVSEN